MIGGETLRCYDDDDGVPQLAPTRRAPCGIGSTELASMIGRLAAPRQNECTSVDLPLCESLLSGIL
ncbi:hypothetical protein HJC23_004671 [Cyclotella cryptica]|uniref:Uncharacterized protein n=1 Tax=Cyclotella cryptica TaxID=29204 RepID=A0ABD3PKL6_9STRA